MFKLFSAPARLVGTGSAVALSLSFLVGAGPSVADEQLESTAPAIVEVTDGDDDGILDAPDGSTASTGARAKGERVEDLSQRTESSSVFANADGTYTRRDFGATVRVKKSGKWVPVDYTLVEQSDGSYTPKASDVDITIDGGSAREAARVDFDDDTSLAFTWPKDLPEPTVDGGVATYRLSKATDLVVAVTGSGVAARIRLNEQPAADDPVFTLGLRADSLDLKQRESTDAIKLTNQDGETVGGTTQLLAWDASTDAVGDPTNVVELDAELSEGATSGDVTDHTLELKAPEGFLSDPKTEYPVTIDPNIRAGGVRDTWVRSGQTTAYGDDFRLIVGKVNPDTSSNTNPARTFLKFFDSRVDTEPKVKITSATLSLWQYYGYSCTDRRMLAYPVGAPWGDGLTWSSALPSMIWTNGTYVDDNRGAAGCGQQWTKLNVTSMVQAWSAGTIDNNGVRLQASDETVSAFERRFCSMDWDSSESICNTSSRSPVLDVNYRIELLSPASPLLPGETRELQVAGMNGIPESVGNGSAVITLTAAEWDASGSAVVYRADADRPEAATLSFTEGTAGPVSRTVTVGVSDDGKIAVTNDSETATGLYVSVQGWTNGSPEPLDDEEIDDPSEPSSEPRMSSKGSCGLPDGVLSVQDLPAGRSVVECDAIGRLVVDGDAGVTIPAVGEVASVSTLTEDGSGEDFAIAVDADGTIGYESHPAAASNGNVSAAAVSPDKCDDETYKKMDREEYNTYNWFIGDGKMPGELSRRATRRQYADAINNITDSYNGCKYKDSVSAAASYQGTTSWESDMTTKDGATYCGSRDGKSTWDAANIDTKGSGETTIAKTCGWTSPMPFANNDLIEADVRFNTTNFKFTKDAKKSCTDRFDIRGIGTHEAGHVFGLSDLKGDHKNLTMSGTGIRCNWSQRYLGKGDIRGLRDIY